MSTPGATPAERRRVYPGADQLALRTAVVVGAAVAMVAAQAAGARPKAWEQVLVLALAVLTALRPESLAGAGLTCAAAYTWSLAPETLSPLVLLAAAGMVLAHVSALVAGQGPARMRVDADQVRTWGRRALLLLAAALVVWGLGVAMADLPQRRLVYALGLTTLIALAVATTVRLRSRPDPAG